MMAAQAAARMLSNRLFIGRSSAARRPLAFDFEPLSGIFGDIRREPVARDDFPWTVRRPGAEPTPRDPDVDLLIRRLSEHCRGRICKMLQRRAIDLLEPRRSIGDDERCRSRGNENGWRISVKGSTSRIGRSAIVE